MTSGGAVAGRRPVPDAPLVVWVRLADQLRDADLQALEPADRRRVTRLVRPADAAAVASGHRRRRELLGQLIGVPAAEVRVDHGPCPACGATDHGPPIARTPAAVSAFSWSRAGRWGLLGWDSGRPLGVDVESRVPTDPERLARRVLAPGEMEDLAACRDREEMVALFLRAWTRKEAVAKATGVGLPIGLRRLEVRPGAAGTVLVPAPGGPWTVTDLDPPEPGLAAAVALRDAGPPAARHLVGDSLVAGPG